MALALDGNIVSVANTAGNGPFNIGSISTTYGNGEVFCFVVVNGTTVSGVTCGGITLTQRATITAGPGPIYEYAGPVGSAPLSSAAVQVTIAASTSFFDACAWVISNTGSVVAFDTGGPQTNGGAPTMTTQETALIMAMAKFLSSTTPTYAAPWSPIFSGVSGSYACIEYQVANAGTYTGAWTQTDENAGIIDALYSPAQGIIPNSGGILRTSFMKPTSWNQV
jgi:hypothetical protein